MSPEPLAQILVFEDDAIDRMALCRRFDSENCINPIEFREDGDAAWALLVDSDPVPEIVLLDLGLPRRSGRQILTDLRLDSRFDSVWVFVMTSADEDEEYLIGESVEADGFLVKPLSPEAIEAQVQRGSERRAPLLFDRAGGSLRILRSLEVR